MLLRSGLHLCVRVHVWAHERAYTLQLTFGSVEHFEEIKKKKIWSLNYFNWQYLIKLRD